MRNIRFGHTAITWPNEEIEQAAAAIGGEGYWGTETFGWVLEAWAAEGRDLAEVFRRSGLQLTSCYCHVDLIDPQRREDGIRQVMDWVELYKPFGGPAVVVGGTMLKRDGFDIGAHAAHAADVLNELGERISEQGLLCCFHPHTGTAVETEEEIHRIMNAVDPNVVRFAPDLGQIAKGGTDPSRIVQEYYEQIRLIHIKDYAGGPIERDEAGRELDKTGFLGYTPLGLGAVDIEGILNDLESRGYEHYALVELDGNQWSATRRGNPMLPPHEAIRESKRYLQRLGYSNFRTE